MNSEIAILFIRFAIKHSFQKNLLLHCLPKRPPCVWTLRDRWRLIANSFSHKSRLLHGKCDTQIFIQDLENLGKCTNCLIHWTSRGLYPLFFVKIFFKLSDLDETSCFIRVQMHGVTLSRHQPICAMADYFPDFSHVFFHLFFSFFCWPTWLAWPRTRT